jgi:hypothetical protein
MLRKTLIAVTAAGALGVSSAALAGHGGGHGGGGHGGGGWGGGGHMAGPTMGGRMAGPMVSGRVHNGPMTFNRNNFNRNNFAFNRNFRDHRFHNRRDRFFFGVGFAGPWYDYGYNSCWVPTYWGGWQYICGYPYGGYGGY